MGIYDSASIYNNFLILTIAKIPNFCYDICNNQNFGKGNYIYGRELLSLGHVSNSKLRKADVGQGKFPILFHPRRNSKITQFKFDVLIDTKIFS